MREDFVCIPPSKIQDTPNTVVSDNEVQNLEKPEINDSAYYSEIVEFLHHELESDAEQKLDEWASKKSSEPGKWLRVMRRRARGYCLVGGKLYHARRGIRSRCPVVVGVEERRAILSGAHVQRDTGVHIGVSKMYAALCTSYFWQGLYRDVKDFVRNCGNCVEVPGRCIPSACLGGDKEELGARTDGECGDAGNHGAVDTDAEGWNGMAHQTEEHSMVEGRVWTRVELNVLSTPLEGHGNQFMLVLADPVSHWISAQAITIDSAAVNVSEASALFAFSTFCTLGFPSVCSVVSEAGIDMVTMWEKLKSLMEPMKLDWLPKKKKAALIRKGEYKGNNGFKLAALSSASGVSLDCESEEVLSSSPVITLHSTTKSSSSCKWAWESMLAYMRRSLGSWSFGLDSFLFEERRRASMSVTRSAFFLMFGRSPICGQRIASDERKNAMRSKRRKLRSSTYECCHCEESFTTRTSFQLHQRKHTEETHRREQKEEGSLVVKETNESHPKATFPSTPISPDSESTSNSNKDATLSPQGERLRELNLAVAEDSVPKSDKKIVVHHCSKLTSCGWKKTHLKIGGMKKQCQRGISRLLALAQVGIGAKAACEKIPRDGQRASFTAQTVASVRASLEAKRKKHIRRGNYQRYSPELREEIAKHALSHGISQAMSHFSSTLGGKPISESTVRNFVRSYCSPANHLSNCLRNKDLGEEIGRFSVYAGTEAAVRYYSSRLGVDVKRGTISRLHRAYLKKHSPPEEGRGTTLRKKKVEVARRKRRYGALLRNEIGNYAAQHGVHAATQHYSERLLFPVQERTITKFLKMYREKESGNKNCSNDDPCEQNPHQNTSVLDKSAPLCPPSCNTTTSVAANPPSHHLQEHSANQQSLMNNNPSDTLDESSSSLVMYGPYGGLTSQQQVVGYNGSSLTSYEVGSSGQTIILDQGDATTALCNSQELDYHHSLQGYLPGNYEDPSTAPSTVASGSLGMNHHAGTVTAMEVSHEEMSTVQHVSMPHVTSPYSGMMAISHQLLHDSQSNASGVLHSQTQVISGHDGEGIREHVSSQSDQCGGMGSNSTLMSVLPSSSFVHHSKSSVLMSSSLLNQGEVDSSMLASTDLSSLQKSMESEMMPPYYPLTITTAQTFQMGNNVMNTTLQIGKDNSGEITTSSQTLILGESLMPTSPVENQSSRTKQKEMPCVPSLSDDKGDVDMETTAFPGPVQLSLGENSVESTVSIALKDNDGNDRSSKEVKKVGKCPQKSKRGNYNFLSPELRARIGKYAAEHGNLKTAKHFEAEVGRQIPESTIRGLRDKYVMKQIQVSSSQSSEGSSGNSIQQVTALGYAPRGRPMVLGKYDEVVQDCMHELVKTGEKVSSSLAIATARQVLTQYEPSLLQEFGGPIRLNNSWAKSFIKRIGLSSSS